MSEDAGSARAFENELGAQRAARVATEARTEIEKTRMDVDRLLMITEALWGILREKFDYPETEIQKRIAEIDARDGAIDGRVEKQGPIECWSCGRTNQPRYAKCIYCGKPLIRNPFQR